MAAAEPGRRRQLESEYTPPEFRVRRAGAGCHGRSPAARPDRQPGGPEPPLARIIIRPRLPRLVVSMAGPGISVTLDPAFRFVRFLRLGMSPGPAQTAQARRRRKNQFCCLDFFHARLVTVTPCPRCPTELRIVSHQSSRR